MSQVIKDLCNTILSESTTISSTGNDVEMKSGNTTVIYRVDTGMVTCVNINGFDMRSLSTYRTWNVDNMIIRACSIKLREWLESKRTK